MARVTVEDCLNVVENRFKLAMLAGFRAKEISKGAEITVERDNDKDTVVALREIAEYHQNIDYLESAYIKDLQKHGHADELQDTDVSNVDGNAIKDRKNSTEAKTKNTAIEKDRKYIEESFISVEDYSIDDETGTEE